jgi:hypothetical protein
MGAKYDLENLFGEKSKSVQKHAEFQVLLKTLKQKDQKRYKQTNLSNINKIGTSA